jgi:hypothetical protein
VKQLKCSSKIEWINKMWHIHTMKCCATMKKNNYKSMQLYEWISKY